jgi:hypothetical protein
VTAGVSGHDGSVASAGPPPEERPTEPFRQVASAPAVRPSARWAIPDIGEARGPGERDGRARVAGMPNASPWQRSHAVWHRADIDWVHGSIDSPPAGVREAEPQVPAPDRKAAPVRRSRRRGLVLGSALVALLVAGAGGYAVLSGEGGAAAVPPPPSATLADRLFALDPAAKTDGLVQELTAVAADGDTVVALGAETGGPDRARFVFSADGGRTWALGTVRAADGAEPAPGEIPRVLAGGGGRWVAFGTLAGGSGTAVWTSGDGRTWVRQTGADGAFGPAEQVRRVARTSTGFMAVGTDGGTGGGTGMAWSSGDGATWQRTDLRGMGDVVGLDRVAAVGPAVVVQGTVRRKVARIESRRGRKRKVIRTVNEDRLWRAADGAKWAQVELPQAQGSYGGPVSVAGGPGAFFAVREGRRVSGTQRRRKVTRFGVVFSSTDGRRWGAVGRVQVAGHAAVSRLSGSTAGLAMVIQLGKDRAAVMRSADGRAWQRGGPELAGAEVRGLTALSGGALVVGQRGDDAYLIPPGAPEVTLASVPGAVRAERTIAAIAADGPKLVVVGSGNGSAAAWTSADGRAFTRATGLSGERLTDVARGPQGYLAVGQDGGDAVAFSSPDGVAWQKVSLPGEGVPEAVTHGPGGYVVAGKADSSALTWHSADLRSWTRGSGTGPGWMRDVTATTSGYAAVGGRTEDGEDEPAVWTSANGRSWTAADTPALPQGLTSGALSRVAARGDTLVAFGSGKGEQATQPFLTTSTDAGRTWQPQQAGPPDSGLTAITQTPAGFLLAGTTGGPGRRDVAFWKSADGRAWQPEQVQGTGLTGAGSQWLNALAVAGADLVAIGMTGDHRGETPLLWRTPLE